MTWAGMWHNATRPDSIIYALIVVNLLLIGKLRKVAWCFGAAAQLGVAVVVHQPIGFVGVAVYATHFVIRRRETWRPLRAATACRVVTGECCLHRLHHPDPTRVGSGTTSTDGSPAWPVSSTSAASAPTTWR